MSLHTGVAGNRYQKVNSHIVQPSSGMNDERRNEINMEIGSKRLLQALWAEHPRIMRHLGAVQP